MAPLFEALSDGDSLVRSLAEQAIGKVKGPGTSDALKIYLLEGSEKEQNLSLARLSVLARGGDPSAANVLLAAVVKESLRSSSESILVQLPAETARTTMVPALKHEDAAVRTAAARILAKHPSPEVIAGVLKAAHPRTLSIPRQTQLTRLRHGEPLEIARGAGNRATHAGGEFEGRRRRRAAGDDLEGPNLALGIFGIETVEDDLDSFLGRQHIQDQRP